MIIKGHWTHKADFPPFFIREIMCLPVRFPTHQTPSEKGSTLTGKNLLRKEWTPFSEGRKNNFDSCFLLSSLKVYPFPLTCWVILQVFFFFFVVC